MWEAFERAYLPRDAELQLLGHDVATKAGGTSVTATLRVDGWQQTVTGTGSGPIAAFVHGLRDAGVATIEVVDYAEHAVSRGADAQAVAYVET
jgi:2-isopropylmalate synthase